MKPASSGIRTCSVDVATSLPVPPWQETCECEASGKREGIAGGRGDTNHVAHEVISRGMIDRRGFVEMRNTDGDLQERGHPGLGIICLVG
jgi:hypothetical protein